MEPPEKAFAIWELPILLLRRCSTRRKVQLVLVLTASDDYTNASAAVDLHVRVTPNNSIAYATRIDTCGLSASLRFFLESLPISRVHVGRAVPHRLVSFALANGTVPERF